jgi:hypothetical protein
MPLAITSSSLRALADVAKPYRSPPVTATRNGRVPRHRFDWSTLGARLVGYTGKKIRVMNAARLIGRRA